MKTIAAITKRTLAAVSFLLLALSACNGELAQAPAPLSPAILQRIEMEIRARYDVPPKVDVAIGPLQVGDFPGYYTIVVTFSDDDKINNFEFLISLDYKTLARLEKIDISQDLTSEINTAGRPVQGSAHARVTVVTFTDYECPFCAQMHTTIFPNLAQEYANRVKFIYVDFPLVESHPWAMRAAIDANCLAAQNPTAYWYFVDYILRNRKLVAGTTPAEAFSNLDKIALEQATLRHLNAAALNACIQKNDEGPVRASMAMGDKLGVNSTPTMFVNGLKASGRLSEEDIRSLFDRAIANSK